MEDKTLQADMLATKFEQPAVSLHPVQYDAKTGKILKNDGHSKFPDHNNETTAISKRNRKSSKKTKQSPMAKTSNSGKNQAHVVSSQHSNPHAMHSTPVQKSPYSDIGDDIRGREINDPHHHHPIKRISPNKKSNSKSDESDPGHTNTPSTRTPKPVYQHVNEKSAKRKRK